MAVLSKLSVLVTVKLDIPMALTKPFSTSSSITCTNAHDSTVIYMYKRVMMCLAGRGVIMYQMGQDGLGGGGRVIRTKGS